MLGIPIARAYCRSISQMVFSPKRSLVIRSARFTGRNTWPPVTLAASVHASIASITQCGTGTVRTRPCLPNRSTMHQRSSSCRRCSKVRAAASDRRRPQPKRTARMARSRSPFKVVTSGAPRRTCACRNESQLPTRTPFDFTPFTRRMPATNSGASNSLSLASTANFRIAERRILIDDEPRPRTSSDVRQAATVALLKPD
jgi:hypothetical protein